MIDKKVEKPEKLIFKKQKFSSELLLRIAPSIVLTGLIVMSLFLSLVDYTARNVRQF